MNTQIPLNLTLPPGGDHYVPIDLDALNTYESIFGITYERISPRDFYADERAFTFTEPERRIFLARNTSGKPMGIVCSSPNDARIYVGCPVGKIAFEKLSPDLIMDVRRAVAHSLGARLADDEKGETRRTLVWGLRKLRCDSYMVAACAVHGLHEFLVHTPSTVMLHKHGCAHGCAHMHVESPVLGTLIPNARRRQVESLFKRMRREAKKIQARQGGTYN